MKRLKWESMELVRGSSLAEMLVSDVLTDITDVAFSAIIISLPKYLNDRFPSRFWTSVTNNMIFSVTAFWGVSRVTAVIRENFNQTTEEASFKE